VEADFIVRQLTWLEVTLDLAGDVPAVVDLLAELKRGGLRLGRIVATPMSLFLDDLRRLYWNEEGGPDARHPRRSDPTPARRIGRRAARIPILAGARRHPFAVAKRPLPDAVAARRGPAPVGEKAKADAEGWARRKARGSFPIAHASGLRGSFPTAHRSGGGGGRRLELILLRAHVLS
jgi:hypothetical protein